MGCAAGGRLRCVGRGAWFRRSLLLGYWLRFLLCLFLWFLLGCLRLLQFRALLRRNFEGAQVVAGFCCYCYPAADLNCLRSVSLLPFESAHSSCRGSLIHTIILARMPSSWASTSICALSVSISRSTSPAEKESPIEVSRRPPPMCQPMYVCLLPPLLMLSWVGRTFLDLPGRDVALGHCRRKCRHAKVVRRERCRCRVKCYTLVSSLSEYSRVATHLFARHGCDIAARQRAPMPYIRQRLKPWGPIGGDGRARWLYGARENAIGSEC